LLTRLRIVQISTVLAFAQDIVVQLNVAVIRSRIVSGDDSSRHRRPVIDVIRQLLAEFCASSPEIEQLGCCRRPERLLRICCDRGAGVRLITRKGNDFTKRFPLVMAAVAALPVRSCLIDG
jgi:hypothetical protein